MSVNREDFGITFEITVGTTKTFQLTILDPDTNLAVDMTDINVYATGVVKIYKPDGTLIDSGTNVSFTDRANGIVSFTILASITTSANAGNWIGEIEFSNITPVIIDQQKFNFNIIESY